MSSLIIEQCIMSEAKMISETPSKAIFRCPIQSVDEVNQNHRMYPSGVLKEGMGNCDGRMKRRAFYSELDHPLPTGNDHVPAGTPGRREPIKTGGDQGRLFRP